MIQIVIVIAQSSAPCHALVCTDPSVSLVRDFSLDSRPTHDSTTAAEGLINHSSTSTSHHSGAHLPFRGDPSVPIDVPLYPISFVLLPPTFSYLKSHTAFFNLPPILIS